jgi:hypothetical protein
VSATTMELPAQPAGFWSRIAWHWRHDPKAEMWLIWWAMVAFYQVFGIVFFAMTRVMPPPKPFWSEARIAQWFSDNHTGLLLGFGIIFMISGLVASCNAIIGYSMRRMSVSRVFAYTYIAIYSMSAIPGMLITGIVLSVAAMRPERDPALQYWLYDTGIMCFDGTMGVFLIGTLIWLIAILIDKNNVFPKWFGYLNICNLLTEVVISPAWIVTRGAMSWNGLVSFWIDTVVFMVYTGVFIMQLRSLIIRDDLGTGPLRP